MEVGGSSLADTYLCLQGYDFMLIYPLGMKTICDTCLESFEYLDEEIERGHKGLVVICPLCNSPNIVEEYDSTDSKSEKGEYQAEELIDREDEESDEEYFDDRNKGRSYY